MFFIILEGSKSKKE